MYRTLYSGDLSIVDIIFSSQLTSLPRTDLSIADTANIRLLLQEICIHFTLGNVLQFRLSFLRYLLFYLLASLMAFSGLSKCRNCKFVGISRSYSSLFHVNCSCKDIYSAMGQRQKYGYNHGDFCCTWTTTSPLQ